MHRLILLGALLVSCTAPAEPAKPAAPSPPSPPTAPTPPTPPTAPTPPPPPIAETPPTPPTPPTPATPPPPLAGHRDLHPLPGLGDGCVEMYSACTPDPKGGKQCTSARYDLDCGKTGQVPEGGDKVRCVCP